MPSGNGEVIHEENPRVLVLSASVGAGHVRAAQAIEQVLHEIVPKAQVLHVDVLDLTNAAFRRLYSKAYLDLVNRAPHFLGYIYDLMDKPVRSGTMRSDRLRLLVEKLNLRRFIQLVQGQRWDLVISTHFLPAEIIASMRQQKRLNVPQVTVTTDFETHRLWVNEPCELYFTATEEGARYLQSWGVQPERTVVTGIPIHPVFSQHKTPADCRAKHGLRNDRPVVLQMAGGFGVGPFENLFRSLLAVERPLQIAVVAGRNELVRKKLETFSAPERHAVKVWGFTNEIDELMAAADLIVSKPGGLTTSESLARGAVMAIVNPTPGQEFRNSDFLLENGAAVKVNNIATLSYKIDAILGDDARLALLRSNVARLARPRAAYDVAQRALTLLPARLRSPCS